jgi:hypothetical protein
MKNILMRLFMIIYMTDYLTKYTLDTYIDIKYEINTDTLPKEDNEMFILYMIQQYDSLLTMYYRKFKKDVTDNPRNL